MPVLGVGKKEYDDMFPETCRSCEVVIQDDKPTMSVHGFFTLAEAFQFGYASDDDGRSVDDHGIIPHENLDMVINKLKAYDGDEIPDFIIQDTLRIFETAKGEDTFVVWL